MGGLKGLAATLGRGGLKRGEVYAAATGSGFGGKPRPVVIIQADIYLEGPTVLVALFTDEEHGREPLRPLFYPDATNGLRKASALSSDTLVTVKQHDFEHRIGVLAPHDLRRVDAALMLVLGLAG